MLTNIFISDLDFANFPGNKESEGGNRRNPKMADFINEVVPQLEMLAASEDEENKVKGQKANFFLNVISSVSTEKRRSHPFFQSIYHFSVNFGYFFT